MFVVYWPLISSNELEQTLLYYVNGKILIEDKIIIVFEFTNYFCKEKTIATVNEHLSSLPHFTITFNDSCNVLPTGYSKCKSKDFNVVLYDRNSLYSFPIQTDKFSLLDKIEAHFGRECKRSRLTELPLSSLPLMNHKKFISADESNDEIIQDKLKLVLPFHANLTNNSVFKFLCRNSQLAKNVEEKLKFPTKDPLIYLDALFGTIIAFVFLQQSYWISQLNISHLIHHLTVTSYEHLISWLMGWPAGLKLNNNLNKFLGEMFLWMLNLWSHFSNAHATNFYAIFMFVILCSLVGMSTLCALLVDILTLITVHLRFIGFISTKIHRFQSYVLFTLFQLFRGKKWNSLRNRYDAADYNSDQLLIGTILFTILAYLYPTVLTYFVPFYATKKMIDLLLAFLSMVQRACLKFPLEMFSIKGQPYSVEFVPVIFKEENRLENVSYFHLKSIPKRRLAIMKDYLKQIIFT